MKKITSMLAIVLALAMALSMMVGCSTTATTAADTTAEPTEAAEETAPTETETEVVGGYTMVSADAAALPADIQAIFDEAAGQYNGMNLTCVGLLGTQVVAGTNYAFLTETTVGEDTTYSVSIVYQDLDGNVTLTSVNELKTPSGDNTEANTMAGGWTVADETYATVSDDNTVALTKALEGWTGVGYTPIALIGTQVVAGTNYLYLCSGTTVTAEPVTSLYFVRVYEDLDGNCTMGDIVSFEIADYNTGSLDTAETETAEATAEPEATEAPAEEATEAAEPALAGGWTVQVAPAANLPEDIAAMFAEAAGQYDGMNLTCVALLGTQVVAGTNYAFLTETTAAGTTNYSITVVYKDLEGGVLLSSVNDIDITAETGAMTQGLEGGYAVAEDTYAVITDDDAAPLTAALEGLVGVGYTPVALLGTQVVAGTNYMYLCQGTTVTAEPVTSFYLITVYGDLEGNNTISNIAEFDFVSYIK